MASLHKTDKEISGSVKPLYTDLNIPVKLFFDILNSKMYSLLGEGPEDQLLKVFEVIFDEYIELGGNPEIKKWYASACKIEALKLVETEAKLLMYTLMYTPMTLEERDTVIDDLNAIKEINANIDKTKDLLEECLRVNQQCLGSLQNRINLLSPAETKQSTEEHKAYIFQQDLARISITLGFQIATNLTMYEFITYKNAAIESVKQREKSVKN